MGEDQGREVEKREKEKEGNCGLNSLPVRGNSSFSLHASRKSQ